jgi:transposase
MRRFVGLDVSQATTAICVVDADGKTLVEGVAATEPGAIASFLRRRAPDAERVGLETGPLSVWLWNELHALGLPPPRASCTRSLRESDRWSPDHR